MSRVPKLRFPEFNEEWEEKKLSEVTKINQGLQIPISDRYIEQVENSFFYITNEFLKENSQKKYFIKNPSQSVLCDENDILMTRTGNTGQVVTNVNGAFHNNFFKIKYDDCISKNYLVYFLRSTKTQNKILSLAGTSTIPDLNHGDFYKIKIPLPLKQEQEKIAFFLTSVDTKIEQLTKKEALLQEYKKGVMTKIFSQEIRFKADDGSEFPEWEENLLGDVLEYIQPTKYLVKDTEYDNSYNIPVLTAGKTFILGYTNETDGIFENNLPVIIFDDFTTANKFVDFPFKAKSSAMRILTPKNNNNIKFIYEAMQMIKYEVGGHERHWISKFTFLNIFMPCIQEQTKIANFLSSIDKKIELISKEIEKAKEFKKGLLQQMFV